MASLTFQQPDVLWFLLSVPLLILTQFVGLQLRKRVAIKFAHFDLLTKSVSSRLFSSSYQKQLRNRDLMLLGTRTLVLLFLILAAAGATVWYHGEASSSDYVLLMDTSNSMTATDFYPDRLEASKAAAQTFLDHVKKPARVGVVTFSAVSFINAEPSFDLGFIKDSVEAIAASDIGGTDIGGAIITGTNLLRGSDQEKTLILLTDGRSNQGIALQDALNYALQENVNIHAIGIGTETGGLLPGLPLVTFTIDEKALGVIANRTGGKYFRATTQEQLTEAYQQIATSKERLLSRSLVSSLMILALGLLFFEWGFLGVTYRTVP